MNEQPKLSTTEYIEQLELALIDLLSGKHAFDIQAFDVQAQTGLSEERCQEIIDLKHNVVNSRYCKRHNISH